MIRTGLTILAATIFAAGAAAQSQTSTPPNTQAPAPQGAQTATNAPPLPTGPSVNAELNSTLDSRKAKVGDKVEARTTEALKKGDEVIVPKGTKLIGHVTEASAREKGDEKSTLAIQFDKAVPRKNEEIAMNFIVMAVAAPAQESFAGGYPSADNGPLAGTNAGSQTSPMGASRPQNPANPAGGNPSYPAAGDDAGSTGSAAAGPLPANSRGVYGLNGLQLMMESSQTSQKTVITSTGKNVHLDGGTRLLLVEQPATPATSGS